MGVFGFMTTRDGCLTVTEIETVPVITARAEEGRKEESDTGLILLMSVQTKPAFLSSSRRCRRGLYLGR